MLQLFRSTFMLYIALFIGQILFCFVVIFLITQPDRLPPGESRYPFLGLLIVFLSAGAAWYLNQLRRTQAGQIRANTEGKVLHYRTSVILRSAVMEAGNLFCLVLALLEHNMNQLLFFAIGLAIFFYFRPQVTEIAEVYGLTKPEKEALAGALRRK